MEQIKRKEKCSAQTHRQVDWRKKSQGWRETGSHEIQGGRWTRLVIRYAPAAPSSARNAETCVITIIMLITCIARGLNTRRNHKKKIKTGTRQREREREEKVTPQHPRDLICSSAQIGQQQHLLPKVYVRSRKKEMRNRSVSLLCGPFLLDNTALSPCLIKKANWQSSGWWYQSVGVFFMSYV